MNELISIIVPVYNVEKYIEETMGCVAAQTYPEWELLLVEDGSRDNTVEIIQGCMDGYPEGKIRLIRQPSNMGAARARNRGLQEARGRYIAFLDADDLWAPEKLEKELFFLREKGAAFVFTGYEFADSQGQGTGKVVHVPERLTYRQALSNTTIFKRHGKDSQAGAGDAGDQKRGYGALVPDPPQRLYGIRPGRKSCQLP